MGGGASIINRKRYTSVKERSVLPIEKNDSTHCLKIVEWPTIERATKFTVPSGNFNSWEFDVWLLEPADLPALCSLIMLQYNVPSKFDIKFGKWCGLFKQVQLNMSSPANPYHNLVHLVDVMQTCAAFLGEIGAANILNDTDILALFLAALVHDIGHPGLSNAYQVHAETPLALRYNDMSVLEHHHCALAFELFQDPKSNVFLDVPSVLRKAVRKSIINLVLSTDMTTHFALSDELSDCVTRHFNSLATIREMESVVLPDKDRMVILRSILHASDISNPAKAWQTSKKWSDLVVEEFFAQGDLEKAKDLPVSMNMDRTKSFQDEISLSFSDYIASPFFLTLLKVFPKLGKAVRYLESNRKQWNNIMRSRISASGNLSNSQKDVDIAKLIAKEDDFAATVRVALSIADSKLCDKLPIPSS
jgi:3'5'-cyclic nucleotide phosphodiesterase